MTPAAEIPLQNTPYPTEPERDVAGQNEISLAFGGVCG